MRRRRGADQRRAPYGPCPSESDVECRDGESCIAGVGCGEHCDDDSDCPEPDVGVPICDWDIEQCVLSCEGNTPCPAGMACGTLYDDLRRVWP